MALDTVHVSSLPYLVGQVCFFAMNSAPTGFLACAGQTVSRTVYAKLFAAIGTTYGAGDGVSTFVLPDLRGEFIRGLDTGRGVDTGRTVGSAQIGSITGGYPNGGSYSFGLGTSSATLAKNAVNGWDTATLSSYPTVYYSGASGGVSPSTTQAGLDASFGVTRPRNVALLACIFVGV